MLRYFLSLSRYVVGLFILVWVVQVLFTSSSFAATVVQSCNSPQVVPISQLEKNNKNMLPSGAKIYETENMNINHSGFHTRFENFDSYVEGVWEEGPHDMRGISIDGDYRVGKATESFSESTGFYDVYISYVDEQDGSWQYLKDRPDKEAEMRGKEQEAYDRWIESGRTLVDGYGTLEVRVGGLDVTVIQNGEKPERCENDTRITRSNGQYRIGSRTNYLRRIGAGVSIQNGQTVEIVLNRSENMFEIGRIDYLAFVPVSSGSTPVPTQPGPTSQPSIQPSAQPTVPTGGGVTITDIQWGDYLPTKSSTNGGDTWPMTWAQDNAIYTAWADADLFGAPRRSLGWAKITGDPQNYSIEGIRSDDEQEGHGSEGKKASGMLAIGDTLYMWMRNADNNGHGCQIARSNDKGVNWDFGFTFSQYGYCSFINFGQGYTGVPASLGDYVYSVTPNGDSAYNPSDGFVLMRVPKTQIMSQGAYEFYKNGSWVGASDQPSEIYSNSGKAARHSLSYVAPLQSYVWWQGITEVNGNFDVDGRFDGTFQVLTAKQPWGPWSKVGEWDWSDPGPGETATFPTKWISNDGKTFYLATSGNDQLSIRQGTFITEGAPQPTAQPTSPNPTGSQCSPQGDLDCSGVVNALDLSILLGQFGTNNATADLDSSGVVNALDLSVLLANFGKSQ